MKKLTLPGFVFLILSLAQAQETNWVVSSSGDHHDSGNYQLSWTLGEAVVHTESSSGASADILTQGFHQPLSECLEVVASILSSDTVVCEEQVILMSTPPPPGWSGEWMTTGSAFIDGPGSTAPHVMGLEPGNNLLTWTLSLRNCTDTDTVNIFYLDAIPVANDDELMRIFEYGASVSGNVLDNDDYPSDDPNVTWALELQDTAGLFGSLDFKPDGSFTYYLTSRTTVDSFTYILRNEQCPEFFDFAGVVIRIDSVATPPDAAEAFSPDGDGMNEVFMIPGLEEGELNELTVFNRWGQLVYQKEGYNNDTVSWNGTHYKTKEPLPVGTYYYILRQEIGEGKLRYGQVVLVR